VILPATYRASLLAIGFNFAYAIGFFVTPRWLSGGHDFLCNLVYKYANSGQLSNASALSLSLLVLAAFPSLLVLVLSFKRRRLVAGR
jgi:ABC-type spermidine/putrescine transport system permease subunit I